MMNRTVSAFRMENLGYACMIIAAVGDLIIPFIIAPFCKEYSLITMVMSLLGNKKYPLHWLYNGWLILAGFLFLLGGVRLYSTYSGISRGLAVALLIILLTFAVGACILAGLFAVGETKELLTISAKIHGYGSVIGFFTLLFAPLVAALISFKTTSPVIGAFSILCFISALIFFTLFVMSDKEQFVNTAIAREGLWQRLCLLFMYAPVVALSVRQIMR